MATDKELWNAAWAELVLTTDSYPTWKKKGYPSSSHWAKAKALGDQIGAVAPPPPPPPTTTGPSFGVHAHVMYSWYTSDADRLALIDLMAAAGVKWLRLDFAWNGFQGTARGQYDQWFVDRADYVVGLCKARGIKVLANVRATPFWASASGADTAPPSNPADFQVFVSWLAARYKGSVQAYEFGNECNSTTFWTGTIAQYATFLQTGYTAVKAVDPAALVVTAGPEFVNTDWVTQAYAAGIKGYFDAVACHPYMAPADLAPELPDDGTIWRISHVQALHDLMVSKGDGAKPIWFTEFGWSSHPNVGGEPNWEKGVTQAMQADYLIRTLTYVAANFPFVTNVFWYNERNNTTGSAQYNNYGLLNADLSVKPAYTAVKNR